MPRQHASYRILFLAALALILVLAAAPSGAADAASAPRSPLAVLLSDESGAKVEVIEKPGADSREIASFPKRSVAFGIDSYLGDEPAPADIGPGKLLLGDERGLFVLDLKTGATRRLTRLFNAYASLLLPQGPVVSTSVHVRTSKDGRYGLFMNFENEKVYDEDAVADVSYILYDAKKKEVIWERLLGKQIYMRGSLYAHFLKDRVLVFIDGKLHQLELKKGAKLTPLCSGSYFECTSLAENWAVLNTSRGDNLLFNLKTLKVEKGVTLPHASQGGQFAFSPDGRHLAYEIALSSEHNAVYLVSTVTGKTVTLNRGKAWNSRPSFTPDGRSLYFIESRAMEFRGGRNVLVSSKVVRRDLDTGSDTALGPELAEVEELDWSGSTRYGYWVAVRAIANADGPIPIDEADSYPAKLLCFPWGADFFETWDTRTGQGSYEWILP